MKKILSFFALAALLLTASCSKQESPVLGEDQVIISLGLEGVSATRAISDGSLVDKLVYEVYDGNGALLGTMDKTETVAFPYSLSLPLAKGQDYTILFWAQDSDCQAYNTDNLKNVTVNYTNAANNDETRDAFYAAVNVHVTGGPQKVDVVLNRPFAQVNVAVPQAEWQRAIDAGVKVEKSSVKFSEVASNINVATGAVSNPVNDVTLGFANIPTERLSIDLNKDKVFTDDEKFVYLSMDYILVNDGSVNGAEKSMINTATFTFKSSVNDVTLSVPNLPVQRNFRTNVIGTFLVDYVDFNIVVDPIYNEPDHQEGYAIVTTKDELQQALDDAEEGKTTFIYFANDIEGDVVVTEKETVGTEVIVDGRGHKYNGQIKIKGNSNQGESALRIQNINFATSVEKHEFIWCNDSSNGSYWRYANNVTIENCTFTAEGAAIHTAVGAKFQQCYNIKLINCTATNMHSLLQAESCKSTVEVVGATVINGKNGVSFNNTLNARISNSEINAVGAGSYGIRHKGQVNGYSLVVSDCEVSAFVPVLVRNMTASNYSLLLSGTNTFTANSISTSPYQVVLSNTDYDGTQDLVRPTGNYTISGAEDFYVYPREVVASNADQFAELVKQGYETICLTAGTYIIPKEVKGKTITVKGNENVVIDATYSYSQNISGAVITFEGVTIKGDNNKDSFKGFTHVQELTFNNCTLNHMLTLYSKTTFNSCKFVNVGSAYSVKTWGAGEVIINESTFNSEKGRGVLYYPASTFKDVETSVAINRCKFIDASNSQGGKAAIEVTDTYYSNNVIFNLNITDTDVTGYHQTEQSSNTYGGTSLGTELWGNKNLLPAERLNVTVDGVVVY